MRWLNQMPESALFRFSFPLLHGSRGGLRRRRGCRRGSLFCLEAGVQVFAYLAFLLTSLQCFGGFLVFRRCRRFLSGGGCGFFGGRGLGGFRFSGIGGEGANRREGETSRQQNASDAFHSNTSFSSYSLYRHKMSVG